MNAFGLLIIILGSMVVGVLVSLHYQPRREMGWYIEPVAPEPVAPGGGCLLILILLAVLVIVALYR